MTLMIDPPLWPAHGRRWSHLISDTSFAELHTFARALGIPERGFDGDHYDVPAHGRRRGGAGEQPGAGAGVARRGVATAEAQG